MEELAESLMLDAAENWGVAIFDILLAYLWPKISKDKTVLVKFEGDFVDIICDVDLSLLDYVRYEHSRNILYLNLDKAFFGCIESAMLWYNLFTKTLNHWISWSTLTTTVYST